MALDFNRKIKEAGKAQLENQDPDYFDDNMSRRSGRSGRSGRSRTSRVSRARSIRSRRSRKPNIYITQTGEDRKNEESPENVHKSATSIKSRAKLAENEMLGMIGELVNKAEEIKREK